MNVTTGFGYFLKDGKIDSKYELPIGEHPIAEGLTAVEVADKDALDAIEVYKEPIVLTPEQELEQLIDAKKRELAISELKKDGKLDVDGKITVSGKASLNESRNSNN